MRARPDVEVWLDEAAAGPVLVGSLRPSFQGGRTLASTSFQYDPGFLARSDAYAISPDLPLIAGRMWAPETGALFGAFADAAPAEWGRKIIEAEHARRRAVDAGLPRRIGGFDILLGVADRTRTGALRLRDPETGEWLSSDPGVANVHDLARILEVAARWEDDEATDDDVAYLNDVATSPGGARPKANVVSDDGRLMIAKLPHSKDGALDVEGWEAVVLTIAGRCGIRVPEWERAVAGATTSVLLSHRFDRDPSGNRRGYISAASALELGEHDGRRVTYEDFSDTIVDLSAEPQADLQDMFTRIALTVLVNNVDDHWRNHGFIHDPRGWRLAPMFDVNPSPRRGTIAARAISADDDPRDRDIRHLVAVSRAFRLSTEEGGRIVASVAREVQRWRETAAGLGLGESQQNAVRRAFDLEQIERAIGFDHPSVE